MLNVLGQYLVLGSPIDRLSEPHIPDLLEQIVCASQHRKRKQIVVTCEPSPLTATCMWCLDIYRSRLCVCLFDRFGVKTANPLPTSARLRKGALEIALASLTKVRYIESKEKEV